MPNLDRTGSDERASRLPTQAKAVVRRADCFTRVYAAGKAASVRHDCHSMQAFVSSQSTWPTPKTGTRIRLMLQSIGQYCSGALRQLPANLVSSLVRFTRYDRARARDSPTSPGSERTI